MTVTSVLASADVTSYSVSHVVDATAVAAVVAAVIGIGVLTAAPQSRGPRIAAGDVPPQPLPPVVHGPSPDETRWIEWAARYGPWRARLAARFAHRTTTTAHRLAHMIIHRLGGHTVCQACRQDRTVFTSPEARLTPSCPSCLLDWQTGPDDSLR